LPEPTAEWKQVLDGVCTTIMDDNMQTKEEETSRNNLLNVIKSIVWTKYPKAKLSLFGSSNNGFAMKKSDLDICMTLDEEDPSNRDVSYAGSQNLTIIVSKFNILLNQGSKSELQEDHTQPGRAFQTTVK
jgi:DNA polymerase sigma